LLLFQPGPAEEPLILMLALPFRISARNFWAD
jgi:hypothetical protein